MKEFQNLNQEEQVDLRIVEHLDMQNLPESLQTMLSLAKTEEEKEHHIEDHHQHEAKGETIGQL